MLNHLVALRYISFLIIVLISLTLFACSKDHDEIAINNPFDPNNPETHGDPYNLCIEAGTDNIKLQWNNIPNIDGVAIYRSTKSDTGFEKIATSSEISYIDSDIKSVETYYYKICAYKNGMEKPSSSIVSMKSPLIIITATAENGGSISPSGNVKVTYGSSQIFNISPNVGYSILDVKVDGVSKGNISSYTFSNITTDHTIKASFSITMTITATAENGGSISPSGNVKVNYGSNQTFNINPNADAVGWYSILDVKVDDVSKGNISSYTFTNVTTDHTIKAIFSIDTFTITPTTEGGGSISPSGKIKVNYRSSQTFNISPNAGYSILDVKVDGVSKGNISSYTFSNITTDHTIKASFSITMTITATAESGGSISPLGNVKVAYGSSQTFNIVPNTGYNISDVQIDGVSKGNISSYTFSNVTTDHTITVSFSITIFTITATAAGSDTPPRAGEISPSGDVKVKYGSDQTFEIIAYGGSTIGDIWLDYGTITVPKGSMEYTYTFKNVIKDHIIFVNYADDRDFFHFKAHMSR
jgi:hypothetical protein